MGDFLSWLLSFFILVSLLVIIIYQLIALADLEYDYINPFDSASKINKVVWPEYITQGALCLLYLVTGHWFMSLLCAPNLCFNARLYQQRRHLIDVTEIFNLLRREKNIRLFKLGYCCVLLFFSLFWTIYSALDEAE